MAQQTINLGAGPNDNTGDDLRTGGDKINDNFTELYAEVATIPDAYTDEQVRDVIGTALIEGSGIEITVNDGGDTITISATGGGGSLEWVPNFTADGEVRIYASEAMTITQQGTSGTGSVAYEKSTAAAPATFSGTSSPATLEAGAWLKVTASAVATLFAVALKRTA
ncbi:hypothetical protein [Croceicoccus sp. BE223]|uniref:hypothetical protein n=1 Tax=Croceicoccus sp. BE223 TaxID=2817716 RepID=UPI00285B1858|nr:hypothetical protein [Croceicoccus sp. BE223]MDR7101532.1 hypothetical protein [Croceicoccus sp. BE223]